MVVESISRGVSVVCRGPRTDSGSLANARNAHGVDAWILGATQPRFQADGRKYDFRVMTAANGVATACAGCGVIGGAGEY